MKNPASNQAFTLVELLIVIVVIGILASISVVSYIGIQSRSRTEKAKTNAATVKRIAESYRDQNNTYPTTVSQFRSGISALPTEISILTSGTLSASNGENSVIYKYVGTPSSASGACMYYWDFRAKSLSSVERLGSATTGNCGTTVGTMPAA